MAKHHFKINAGAHGVNTTVEMDGEPLVGARAIRMETSADQATTVVVEFVNVELEFEGDAKAEGFVEASAFGAENRTYRRRGLTPDEPAEGLSPEAVVSALREYVRRNGRLPF